MVHDLNDTICAVASPRGGAARGVVRLSGPQAVESAARFCEPRDRCSLAGLRSASVVEGALSLAGLASTLPCELYVWPDERSYTREPMVEVHTLGSSPLLVAVVRQFCAGGARLAEPGEFTLRAFLAGRIDLTQAEAVLGVVESVDSRELRVALSQMAGGLSRPLTELHERLIELLAQLEAGLDFAEEDIEFVGSAELVSRLRSASGLVAQLVGRIKSRALSGETARVVFSGSPNAGKSALFNALAGGESAITSPLAGTTRDYLTATIHVDGLAVQLIDTAGTQAGGIATVHEPNSEDDVSVAAKALAKRERGNADVELFCIDSSRRLSNWQRNELARPSNSRRIVVVTKSDLPRQLEPLPAEITTSSRSGEGLDLLRAAIRRSVAGSLRSDATVVAGTAQRCEQSLRMAAECLDRAEHLSSNGGHEELVAAEIRAALHELGKVVGAVYTDDILDRIFSQFCIGK